MTGPVRAYDVVLYGASGFVGRLTARHLADHAPGGARIALAGRDRARVEAVRRGLGPGAADWDIVVADAGDAAALADLAASTRTVATTVGPYVRHGLPLAAACAGAGTHYADLTGEVLFVRRSADEIHHLAAARGAKIVHACGFDSIPSDIGVLLTAQASRAAGDGDLTTTVNYVRSLRGGFSGGTIDSMRTQVLETRASAVDRRTVADPYGLSPNRSREPDRTPRAKEGGPLGGITGLARRSPVRRTADGHWTGPFVMAGFNARIVRRSNALLDYAYGRQFRYQEVMDFGTSPTSPAMAIGVAAGLLGLATGMRTAPTRTVLDRMLPKPGDGPSPQAQAAGHFRMEIESSTMSGARYRTTFGANVDPGYSATAIMLGQSALALAFDALADRAGVLTPAAGIGAGLADRLRACGFTITTQRLSPDGKR